MQRPLPALGSTRALLPVIVFRWLLWGLTMAMVGAGLPSRAEASFLATIMLLGATAAYTLLWTLRAGELTRFVMRRPLLFVADLIICLVPAWLTGGWLSPFALLALGALILPGALSHWRGALVAITVFFIIDHLGAWLFSQPGDLIPIAAPSGLLLYTRPVIAAVIWPLSVELWKMRNGARRLLDSQPTRPLSLATNMTRFPREHEVGAIPASREDGTTATALSLVRARPQTLEHPPLVVLHAALRQTIADAEEQGLVVQLVLNGPDPMLPPGHVQLMVKTVEVALHNIRCHARTRDAEVTVTHEEENMLLIIRDQGAGLLDGTAEPPGFHQLKRLRYRAEEVEGSLDVREDVGGGVFVTLRVPI